jgi:hypothetical protein
MLASARRRKILENPMRTALFAAGLALLVLPANAADVEVEKSINGESAVTLYVQPFLDATELAMLRLVATNKEALALFVPSAKGYAAMAAAPKEGFIKDGAPVPSAVALSDLPDAATASEAALKACNAARKTSVDCVILLEVGPAK